MCLQWSGINLQDFKYFAWNVEVKYFMVVGASLWHRYLHVENTAECVNIKSAFYSHEQGQPDICCHTSLCCAAGTTGCVCRQRGACPPGGRDRNWKDLHCAAPDQSHRWAQEAKAKSLLIKISPSVTAHGLSPLLIQIFPIVCSIQDTDCGLWTWTSRVTLPTCSEGEWSK